MSKERVVAVPRCAFAKCGMLALLVVVCSWDRVSGNDFFRNSVLPILQDHCFDCHSHAAGESEGGLVLDSLYAMVAGGARGSAIDTALLRADGDAQLTPEQMRTTASKSLLLKAVEYQDSDLQMPPDEPLSSEQVVVLRRWLESGAPVPSDFQGSKQNAAVDWQGHWSYQPIPPWNQIRQQLSTGATAGASNNPVDQAISIAQMAVGLTTSEPADFETLRWRISYDLTGLPPNASMVQANDSELVDRGQTVPQLIEDLLASGQYGERWARHWMDVARYADNKGYVFQEDREYPEAYKYRDWLIGAFNSDLPYDRFVKLQLAADLVPDARAEDIAALGFLTLGRRFLNNKHDIIDDRIDVLSRGLMGMTLACARCHDHKYDPATQADYYALYGVLNNSHEPGGEPWPHRLQEKDKFSDAYIFVRGVAGRRGKKVPRRFVSFLSNEQAAEFEVGSGRLELANRIAASDNPLTARVVSNRVWMHLMGRPLVSTPSDFGIRSEEPRQSQLLDTLAAYLIDQDWSLKQLIRLIVSSDTYQQQSASRSDCVTADPENELYWKANRKRRDFESLRDTLLSAANQLDLSAGGKSQRIDEATPMSRRTVYAYIDRQNLPSVFRTFDLASPDAHTPRRAETSVPQQGLYLLNSNFVATLASRLASESANKFAGATAEQRVDWIFAQVLVRKPSVRERSSALELVRFTNTNKLDHAVGAAWQYGYTSIAADEKRMGDFVALPHFSGSAWQGGGDMPDAALGWCQLNAAGGHPGNDLAHAVVRRWTSPVDGAISISGKLSHKSDKGDGVRGWIFRNGKDQELFKQRNAANGRFLTVVKHMDVSAGDHVDFVTDCLAGPSFDSFQWKVNVELHPTKRGFASETGFGGPAPPPLDGWATLCQALLASNELAFVD